MATTMPDMGSVGANIKLRLSNLEAQKAPLASPALTGSPTAPTAAKGTNSTKIATTAFVHLEVDDAVAQAAGFSAALDEFISENGL